MNRLSRALSSMRIRLMGVDIAQKKPRRTRKQSAFVATLHVPSCETVQVGRAKYATSGCATRR
jgi:hypothetical protein